MRRLRDSTKDRYAASTSSPLAGSDGRYRQGTKSHQPSLSSFNSKVDDVKDGDGAQAEVPEVASGPLPSLEEITSLDTDNMSLDDDEHNEVGSQPSIRHSIPVASSPLRAGNDVSPHSSNSANAHEACRGTSGPDEDGTLDESENIPFTDTSNTCLQAFSPTADRQSFASLPDEFIGDQSDGSGWSTSSAMPQILSEEPDSARTTSATAASRQAVNDLDTRETTTRSDAAPTPCIESIVRMGPEAEQSAAGTHITVSESASGQGAVVTEERQPDSPSPRPGHGSVAEVVPETQVSSPSEPPSTPTPINPHSISMTSPASVASGGGTPAFASPEVVPNGSSTSLSPAPSRLDTPDPAPDQQASSGSGVTRPPMTPSSREHLGTLLPQLGSVEPSEPSTTPSVAETAPSRNLNSLRQPKRRVRSRKSASGRPTQDANAADSDSSSADEESALGKVSGKQPALRPKRKQTAARKDSQAPIRGDLSLNEMSLCIPSNYREQNLDTAGVRISAKAGLLNPLEIGISSNTKGKVLLTKSKVKELNRLLDSVLTKQAIGNNPSADEREITFMVKLFGGCASTRPVTGWLGVALHQQREEKDSQHKSSFHEIFMYSSVLVGCHVHGIAVCVLLPARHLLLPLTDFRSRRR